MSTSQINHQVSARMKDRLILVILICATPTLAVVEGRSGGHDARQRSYDTALSSELQQHPPSSSSIKVVQLKKSRALPWTGVGRPPDDYTVPPPPITPRWRFMPAAGDTGLLWPQIVHALRLSSELDDTRQRHDTHEQGSAFRRSDVTTATAAHTAVVASITTTSPTTSPSSVSDDAGEWLSLDHDHLRAPHIASTKQANTHSRRGRMFDAMIHSDRQTVPLKAVIAVASPQSLPSHRGPTGIGTTAPATTTSKPGLAARQGRAHGENGLFVAANTVHKSATKTPGNSFQYRLRHLQPQLGSARMGTTYIQSTMHNSIYNKPRRTNKIRRRLSTPKWMTRSKKPKRLVKTMFRRLLGDIPTIKERYTPRAPTPREIWREQGNNDAYKTFSSVGHTKFHQHPSSVMTAPQPPLTDSINVLRAQYHLPQYNYGIHSNVGHVEKFRLTEAIQHNDKPHEDDYGLLPNNIKHEQKDPRRSNKAKTQYDPYEFMPVFSSYRTQGDRADKMNQWTSNEMKNEFPQTPTIVNQHTHTEQQKQSSRQQYALPLATMNTLSWPKAEKSNKHQNSAKNAATSELKEDGTLVVTATLMSGTDEPKKEAVALGLRTKYASSTASTGSQASRERDFARAPVVVQASAQQIRRRHLDTVDRTMMPNLPLPWQPSQHAAMKLHQLIEAKYSR